MIQHKSDFATTANFINEKYFFPNCPKYAKIFVYVKKIGLSPESPTYTFLKNHLSKWNLCVQEGRKFHSFGVYLHIFMRLSKTSSAWSVKGLILDRKIDIFKKVRYFGQGNKMLCTLIFKGMVIDHGRGRGGPTQL